MDRNIRFAFDQPFSMDSLDIYICEFKEGKSYAATPVDLKFVLVSGYQHRDPCISLQGADFKKFLGNMRDFLASNGYLGSDQKEIKRLEDHIKDLQSVIEVHKVLLEKMMRPAPIYMPTGKTSVSSSGEIYQRP